MFTVDELIAELEKVREHWGGEIPVLAYDDEGFAARGVGGAHVLPVELTPDLDSGDRAGVAYIQLGPRLQEPSPRTIEAASLTRGWMLYMGVERE